MGKKIRVNISIDEDVWKELGKYIDGNKSPWVEQQARKQIERHDDIEEIDMKIQAIEYQQKNLEFDKSSLLEERESLIKQREENRENLKLINDVLFTIKTIVNNQGCIERGRVEFISNKNKLDSNIVFSQLEKEGINVIDGNAPKEELRGIESVKKFSHF